MSRPLWVQTILLLVLQSCRCIPLGATAGIVPVTTVDQVNYPQYAFSYAVHDPHTNDKKAHWETRDGDEVNGAYSLLEPDGTVRVVEYNANSHKGFTAVVKRLGDSVHPTKIIEHVPLVLNPAPHVTEHIAPALPVPIPLPAPPLEIHAPAKLEVTQPIGTNVEITHDVTDHHVEVPTGSYGLGAAELSVGVPNVVFQKGSLPWDPATGSYGGWRPLHGPTPKETYATIISRKYVNGNLHKIVTGPISLVGKTLYIRKSHR